MDTLDFGVDLYDVRGTESTGGIHFHSWKLFLCEINRFRISFSAFLVFEGKVVLSALYSPYSGQDLR